MDRSRRSGGLDAFKIPAALLVVAIHVSPLASFSLAGDFFLTRVLARVAVPFFFMVTGQFVLGPVLAGRASPRLLWRQSKKILALYGIAILLYLPIGLYAGHYQNLRPLDWLRLLLFDGTFYHLWYFPACVMGLWVVFLLSRVLGGKGLLAWPVRPPACLPDLSTWIYLLHPAMVVVVRGGAKVTGLTGLLVENSLVHYLAVCLLSCLAAAVILWGKGRLRPPRPRRDRAWITLDRAALAHNRAALEALLPPGCRLMPAVKANAYGHGALPIARELASQGIDAFCVACLDEGIQLRRGGIRGEILLLGYTPPDQFSLLRRYKLTQTVVDFPYAQQLNAFGKPLAVHLAVDTGMHRLGIPAAHLGEIAQVFALPHLRVTGLYTHLCTADGAGPEAQGCVQRQREAFRQLLEGLKNQGIPLPKVHLLASHGLLNYPDCGGDWARVGIALYGLLSSPEDRNDAGPDLRPVLSLRARVATVRTLPPGAGAGYGLAFTARRPTRLAVLTIGYADGLPRCLEGGCVLLHGRRAPIVGRLCMDQTLVDVTDLPAVQAGDTAVVIGTDGQETISAMEVAQRCGTITNELLSRLGPRLERFLS